MESEEIELCIRWTNETAKGRVALNPTRDEDLTGIPHFQEAKPWAPQSSMPEHEQIT